MPADAITQPSGGNLSPTTPGLTAPVGGGNLAPTAPASLVANGAAGSPTAPGLKEAVAAGNLSPAAPASLVANGAAGSPATPGRVTQVYSGIPVNPPEAIQPGNPVSGAGPLTQEAIELAITDDAAFRAAIGADPFLIYRYPNVGNGQRLLMEGITNGKQCEIVAQIGDYTSQVWKVRSGEMIADGIIVSSADAPKYFQINIDSRGYSPYAYIAFANGSIPALLSPSLATVMAGFRDVYFSAIDGDRLVCNAIYSINVHFCPASEIYASSESAEISDCQVSDVFFTGDVLYLVSCPNVVSVPDPETIEYLSIESCLNFTQAVPGGSASPLSRDFVDTGLTFYNAVGKYDRLHLYYNNSLMAVNLSGVTACADLFIYGNGCDIDAVFASITDVTAFAGGTIVTGPSSPIPPDFAINGPNWTSASDAKIAALNAVGCTVICID